jgi:hypothetical protein
MERSFVFLTLLFLLPTVFCGQFITFSYSGRSNKLFIPSAYNQGTALPLYVMYDKKKSYIFDFVGCMVALKTQLISRQVFSTIILLRKIQGTKMNEYGDKYNLLVLYPEQTSSANSNKVYFFRCRQVTSSVGTGSKLLTSLVAQANQLSSLEW